jgi:flavin-dependent dehydrogenase
VAARRAGTAQHAFGTLLETVSPAAAERVSAARAPQRLRGFAGMPGYVRRSWGPGWALVGDAGCFEDPLSTHGITDALRDAELLDVAVGEIHSGTATEATALAGYQKTRDALAGRLFGTVETIASFTWTIPELQRLLLEASSAMSEQVEALQSFDQHDRSRAAVLAG